MGFVCYLSPRRWLMHAYGNRCSGVYFFGLVVRVRTGDRDMGWCSEIYDPLNFRCLVWR